MRPCCAARGKAQPSKLTYALSPYFWKTIPVPRSSLAAGAVLILNALTFGSLLEGIMGIFDIPLDFATAIIGSVAIGTGIDYAIPLHHPLHPRA